MDEDEFRERILEDFKWLRIEESDNPYLVIGDDLDAAMSACLWNSVFPQNWEIIVIYAGYQYKYCKKEYESKLKSAIWLDLDITQREIRSVGHHILKIRLTDE